MVRPLFAGGGEQFGKALRNNVGTAFGLSSTFALSSFQCFSTRSTSLNCIGSTD